MTTSPEPATPATRPTRASRAVRARSFDAAADRYAAARPSYPPALLDAVEELAGRPLAGARVVDVGAGTGIATALLHARGARVTGVEPGDGMAARFRRDLPDVPLVRGVGDALPLATGSADLLTYAQSWHWTDPDRSVPEALRVLRPGGALALWWNTGPRDVPWIAEQERRVEARFGVEEPGLRGVEARLAETARRVGGARRTVRWSRRVPLGTHLANLASRSLFLTRDAEQGRAFLAEERRCLSDVFPDGVVEETYDVVLLVATTPRDA
ncbi:methyltransferase domain-containing protein [Streptomyces sp. SCSIO 75703]|uniref:class I SAM-dependent methyltransferase n=1 Tax=unclassified Streptomyces TaxID=2593676 RepID=UPI0004BFC169|nr:class I SAM-dependent methyltransferase [Streptomyces sp. NRRL F-5065]